MPRRLSRRRSRSCASWAGRRGSPRLQEVGRGANSDAAVPDGAKRTPAGRRAGGGRGGGGVARPAAGGPADRGGSDGLVAGSATGGQCGGGVRRGLAARSAPGGRIGRGGGKRPRGPTGGAGLFLH